MFIYANPVLKATVLPYHCDKSYYCEKCFSGCDLLAPHLEKVIIDSRCIINDCKQRYGDLINESNKTHGGRVCVVMGVRRLFTSSHTVACRNNDFS